MFEEIQDAIKQSEPGENTDSKKRAVAGQLMIEDWVFTKSTDMMALIDRFVETKSENNMYVKSSTVKVLLEHLLERLDKTDDDYREQQEIIEGLNNRLKRKKTGYCPNYYSNDIEAIKLGIQESSQIGAPLNIVWAHNAIQFLLDECQRSKLEVDNLKYFKALADLYLEDREK